MAEDMNSRKGTPFVFISYTDHDAYQARKIESILRSEGVRTWAEKGMPLRNYMWTPERKEYLLHCDLVIPVLSEEYVQSTILMEELMMADSLERRILPVYLERFCLYGEFETLLSNKGSLFIQDDGFPQKLVTAVMTVPGNTVFSDTSPIKIPDEILSQWDLITYRIEQKKDELQQLLIKYNEASNVIQRSMILTRTGLRQSFLASSGSALDDIIIQAKKIKNILTKRQLAPERLTDTVHLITSLEEQVSLLARSPEGTGSAAAFAGLAGSLQAVQTSLLGLLSDREPQEKSRPVLMIGKINAKDGHGNRGIRFFHGDLTDSDQGYDVVCCSAFKGSYVPNYHTLIGSLWTRKGISVDELAENPELNMRDMGGWLSHPTNDQFRRILCVELTDYVKCFSSQSCNTDDIPVLRSSFLTLRNLLERASVQGIEIRRIALPILGSGLQKIEIEYIAPPLITQCMNMFQTIPSLETVDFYELDREKLQRLISACEGILKQNVSESPAVFISYSSAQKDLAHSIWNEMQDKGIRSWIAPESIPAGSNYLSAIARTIPSIRMVLLLLTEEAQKSNWVPKEIETAVTSGKPILAVQVSPITLTPEMNLMLRGSQIYQMWQDENTCQIATIVQAVQTQLNEI